MTDRVIVYAEDDRGLRTVAVTVLKKMGYEVHAYDDGKPALEEIRVLAAQKKPAVLLTDNDMPQMSGLDVIAALAQDGIRVPTIMLTAHEKIAEKIEAAGLADKVDRLLTKPLDARVIREVVPAVCEKHDRLQPNSHEGFARKQNGWKPNL